MKTNHALAPINRSFEMRADTDRATGKWVRKIRDISARLFRAV